MTAVLTVGNTTHSGWERIRIDLSMENLSGGFNFEVSEKWPTGERAIKRGERCSVSIENTTVITGYISDVEPAIDARSHTLNISGRDHAGDLVDCSAINKPGQWSGVGMGVIVKALCKPFGIPVSIETDLGKPFKKFNIQQGEAVLEAISRMAELRGVLVYSDGLGGIIIGNRATKRTADPIVCLFNDPTNSNNVISARLMDTDTQRFSKVIVKGQSQGSDALDVDSTRGPTGTATDPKITRYRPLLVMAEGQANARQCQERADWEIRTRRGAGYQLSCRVQGWTQTTGKLWEINTIAPVKIDVHKISTDMLITGVAYNLDATGTTTDLTLTLPEAYDRIQRPEDAA